MTLSITITTPGYVCQVSDRRLRRIRPNRTTELYTDHANKATLLQCKDAIVAITYHGIGENLNRDRTDVWLVKTLQKSNPTKNSIKKVLEELAEQASAWMDSIRSDSRGPVEAFCHTFVVAGWTNGTIPIVFYVSNYEHLKTKAESKQPWPEFAGSFSRPKPNSENPVSVHAGGAYKSLSDENIALLTRVVQTPGCKPEDMVNIAVRAIRNVAETCNLIGKNCISTLLLPGKPEIVFDKLKGTHLAEL